MDARARPLLPGRKAGTGDDGAPGADERGGAPPTLLKYDGVLSPLTIPGLPTREGLVREGGGAAPTAALAAEIQAGARVYVLPCDVRGVTDYADGRGVYKLHLFGALTNGAKAHVIVDGVAVFFDVRVPEGGDPDAFEQRLRLTCLDRGGAPARVETVEAAPLRGYRGGAKAVWKRLHFFNLQERKRALLAVRDLGHETASDDAANYHRMAARVHGLVLTDWLALTGYTHRHGGGAGSPLSEHVFRLPVERIAPLSEPMAPPAEGGRDHRGLLVLAWDIETHDSGRSGEVPRAESPSTRVYMIGLTVHWSGEAEPLRRVCLVDTPAAPDRGWATVVCGSEEGVLRAFAVACRHFAPDLLVGFNDSDYDWPFVIEKGRQHGILPFMVEAMTAAPDRRPPTEDSVLDFYVKRVRVKIGAEETAFATFLKVPGCVPADVRTVFRQLYPRAEVGKGSSLNFYLRACSLPPKEDMPHWRAWEIYEAGDPALLRSVAQYCVVDAQRCQELLVRRNVVADRREVAALSYVSLYDALYYAGGHKVCNLLAAHAARRGILCSSFGLKGAAPGARYPGAWVFHPEKGLVPDPQDPGVAALEAARAAVLAGGGAAAEQAALAALVGYRPGRPVTGLDFASLYPSLIMAYNLSPEKFVESEAEAARLAADGRELHFTEFDYGGRPVRGWFVRHGGVAAEYGLFPAVLVELFNRRALLKTRLAEVGRERERLEALLGAGGGADDPELLAAWREALFAQTAVDSKQKALKGFMNTFYGEAGNGLSPFFLLQLAGGVTTAGQAVIKKVADFVTARGFRLKYGDTDSLYITPPDSTFSSLDRRYALGALSKEDHWRGMIVTSMSELNGLRDEVNEFLAAETGTRHLVMAYEEVLYPVAFIGKKKYFGVAHISSPNLHPKTLFIRGIDVIKQGQTELAKKIGHRVMWKAVDIANSQTLLAIVEAVLREAVENHGQWTFEDFVMTDAWRPDKDNKAVQRFVARMRIRAAEERAEGERRKLRGLVETEFQRPRYSTPDPGERFSYVLVKPAAAFTLQGLRASPKKGDVMEYAENARALQLPIDVALYLKSYVVGLCARFVSHAACFFPPGAAGLDEKSLDQKTYDTARKYLETFVAALQHTVGPEVLRSRGYAYRRAWRCASADGRELLHRTLGPVSDAFLQASAPPEPPMVDGGGLAASLLAEAERAAAVLVRVKDQLSWPAAYAAVAKIAANGGDVGGGGASRLYHAVSLYAPPNGRLVDGLLERRKDALRGRIALLAPAAEAAYEGSLAQGVVAWRAREHAANPSRLGGSPDGVPAAPSSEGAEALLRDLRKAWQELVGVYRTLGQRRALADHLSALKARWLHYPTPPAQTQIDRVIAAFVLTLPPLGLTPIGGGGY